MKTIVVERSADGIQFDRLTEVTPKGSSSIGASYSAEDMYPLPGTGFYRLKIVDLDGSIGFSKIIRVDMPAKTIAITQLYPNPVTDFVKVQIFADIQQPVNLRVFDISGKKIMEKNINLDKGLNNTSLSFLNFQSGLYIIRCGNAAGTEIGSYKILKK